MDIPVSRSQSSADSPDPAEGSGPARDAAPSASAQKPARRKPAPDINEGKSPEQGKTSNNELWAWIVVGVAIVAVVLLALATTLGWGPFNDKQGGGGNDTASTAGGASTGSEETVTKQVTVDDMAFVPNRLEVPRGANLVIDFQNTNDQAHDLKVNGVETGRVQPSESATLEVGTVKEDMEGWCTIAGHRMQGMTLDVVATDDGATDDGGTGSAASDVTPADLSADPGENFEAFNPELSSAPEGSTHEYDWEITKDTREIAPGGTQERWLFNGQTPGPVLRGSVGDTFRLNIRNKGEEAHSFVFTGADATPRDSATVINPREEKTVEFTAKHPGMWLYRSGTEPAALNVANGLYGAVIIDDNTPHVDREYGLLGSELYLQSDSEHPGADPARVADGDFDLLAFNGYPAQYLHDPITVEKGETVRFWVLNAGPGDALTFGIDGETLDTVFADGRFETRDGAAHALELGPSQGGFVDVTFNEAGTYTFGNQNPSLADRGQRGEIVVK